MSYTKGKWEVALPKHPDIRQTEDRLIYVRVGDKKLHIAEVYQYQNHNNREANGTAVANARLIAAAPQLLEACKTHRDCLEINVAAYVEDSEAINKILDKYDLSSNVALEEVRDMRIKAAIEAAERS